jgi:hypothetical protein
MYQYATAKRLSGIDLLIIARKNEPTGRPATFSTGSVSAKIVIRFWLGEAGVSAIFE